jgi:hypothetical protein
MSAILRISFFIGVSRLCRLADYYQRLPRQTVIYITLAVVSHLTLGNNSATGPMFLRS